MINVSRIPEILEEYVHMQLKEEKKPIPLFVGRPGIGKSEVVAQFCAKKHYNLIVEHLGLAPLSRITGTPTLEDGRWTPPEFFRTPPDKAYDDAKATILFLDDIHLASRTIQKYLFQLLLNYKILQHPLPKDWIIVLAGNRVQDRAGHEGFLSPVINRLAILEVDTSLDTWIDSFAIPNNIDFRIVTFVKHYNMCFQAKEPSDVEPWSSPRSWAMLSHELKYFKDKIESGMFELHDIVRSRVSDEHAKKFVEYILLYSQWDEKVGKIIKEPKKWKTIVDLGSLETLDVYAFVSAFTSELIAQNVDYVPEWTEIYKEISNSTSVRPLLTLALKLIVSAREDFCDILLQDPNIMEAARNMLVKE
jgi:hypothetical protein